MKPHKALERLGKASDAVLHNAVSKTGLSRQLSGLYIQTESDNADVDKFRGVSSSPPCPSNQKQNAQLAQGSVRRVKGFRVCLDVLGTTSVDVMHQTTNLSFKTSSSEGVNFSMSSFCSS